jgi:hypothetical protein
VPRWKPATSTRIVARPTSRRTFVNDLIRYLMENMYIDFQGEISMETVRNFLKADDSREARALMNKLVADKGVDDMLLTMADCLKEHIRTGISEDLVYDQIGSYSDS